MRARRAPPGAWTISKDWTRKVHGTRPGHSPRHLTYCPDIHATEGFRWDDGEGGVRCGRGGRARGVAGWRPARGAALSARPPPQPPPTPPRAPPRARGLPPAVTAGAERVV